MRDRPVKFKMAENSLFAVLLRSRWWISFAICAAVVLVSLAVFIWRGQVWWDIGLVLAAGSIIGAKIGVKTTVKLKPNTLRWILFVMTLVAVVMALIS